MFSGGLVPSFRISQTKHPVGSFQVHVDLFLLLLTTHTLVGSTVGHHQGRHPYVFMGGARVLWDVRKLFLFVARASWLHGSWFQQR